MGFGKCIPVCDYLISDFEGQRSKPEVGEGEEGTSERRFVCLFLGREFVGFEISKPIIKGYC